MAKKLSPLAKAVAAFLTENATHNVKALGIITLVIQHHVQHNDWDQLIRLIQGVDPKMGKVMRTITAKVFPNMKLGKSESHDTKHEFTKREAGKALNEVCQEELDQLEAFAGKSIYAVDVLDHYFPKDREEKPYSKELGLKLAKNLKKTLMAKHGLTLAEIIDLLREA